VAFNLDVVRRISSSDRGRPDRFKLDQHPRRVVSFPREIGLELRWHLERL
jgi:hypothetical protein